MTRFDHQQLDDVIHARIRLTVMAVLAGVDEADFVHLREQVRTTDGNLTTHLAKLAEAGYVTLRKRSDGGKPLTRVRLTARGRAAFADYVQTLAALVGR
jgi:DNA-binding MarR family transcriptional regulator